MKCPTCGHEVDQVMKTKLKIGPNPRLEIIKLSEAADILGVDRRTCTKYIECDLLSAVKLPIGRHGAWRINRLSVLRLKGVDVDVLFPEEVDEPEPGKEFVYFLQEGGNGLIKIGYSRYPKERMRNLQLCCPIQLRCLGYFVGTQEDEGALHEKFVIQRRHGEWFVPAPEIFDHIESLKKEQENSRT